MNIRTAILKAADSIEQNPAMYNFNSLTVPSCGSPGCLIGLIGCHFGIIEGTMNPNTCKEVFGLNDTMIFYHRIDSLADGMWTTDSKIAAKALRLYADKYHPEESVIPESVMAIFKTEQMAEEIHEMD